MTPVERSLRDVRAEWHAYRTSKIGLGASDAPAVLGVGRKTALRLWMELLGMVDREAELPDHVKEAGEWGTRLEPVVLREYALDRELFVLGHDEWMNVVLYTPTGRAIHEDSHRFEANVSTAAVNLLNGLMHPRHTFLFAHPDGFVVDDGAPVEIVQAKTASAYLSKEWGQEGSDEIPEAYIVQAQFEQRLVELELGRPLATTFPLLLGGQKGRQYRVEPHAELQKVIEHRMVRFWTENVEKKVRPEPQDGADFMGFLQAAYPRTTGEERIATEEEHELALELAQVQLELEAAKGREAWLKAQIMDSMGTTKKIQGDGWSATWFEKRGKPAYKAIAEALAPEGEIPADLLEEHRERTTRVLLPTLKKLREVEV